MNRHFPGSPSAPDPSISHNRATYENRGIVGRYVHSDALYPAEARIFEQYPRQFGGNVLDVAIGAGRTTRALLPLCSRYVGLDYSAKMIAAAQRTFPDAELRVMDMRGIPQAFASQRFDAILISFNAIDYIAWADRLNLLAALPELLAPDGVLAFSSHDLASAKEQSGFHLRSDLQQSLATIYRPRSLARLLLRAPPWLLKAFRNRHLNRGLEYSHEEEGYARVNDAAEDYGLLSVYVTVGRQVELLKACGFTQVQTLQPWLLPGSAYFKYYACQR